MKNKKAKKSSRRRFLDNALFTGTGLIVGAAASREILKSDENNVTKMITLDGKVVEVDVRHVQAMCGGKISNSSLKELVEKEKLSQRKSNIK